MTKSDDIDFENILDDAESETLGQFSSRISKLTKLTQEEIKDICPTKTEQEALQELIRIVNSGAAANEQKIRVVQNAQKLGGVLLAIAKKVISPL